MKKNLRGLFALAAIAAFNFSPAAAAEKITVAVTAIVEHPSLDAVRDGLRETLASAGYTKDNLNFVYESAQGQPATAAQIARRFVGMAPAVIVGISTPSAQTAASATKDIPIVYSAVTDPISAGLVSSMDASGSGNVTGVSDRSPINAQLSLFTKLQPTMKRVGIPYNPGESNSISSLEQFKVEAKAKGIEVVAVPANRTADVRAATQQLVGKVDAIYLLADNTVTSAFETILTVAVEAKIPVYSNDTANVEKGAIASVGFSYFDIGKQTGNLVLQILKGKKPSEIGSEYAQGTTVVVNKTSADKFGIVIPDDVAATATMIAK